MLAYLVIREGTKWTDVFRLTPGRTVTIGRGSTNEIVIKDERCSRNHAEVFLTSGEWTIRDLDSRNGTIVRGQAIHGDHALSPGDVVKIAHCQLAFVHDLSKAFVDYEEESSSPDGRETVSGAVFIGLSDSHVLDSFEPTHITHRRGQTKFLEKKLEVDVASVPKVGQAATKLCRLALEGTGEHLFGTVFDHKGPKPEGMNEKTKDMFRDTFLMSLQTPTRRQDMVWFSAPVCVVYVMSLTGRVLMIHVPLDALVEALMLAVQSCDGTPVDQQRIIFGGRQLEMGRTLASYDVRDACSVHLVQRLRGC